jgi:hypothetical protein
LIREVRHFLCGAKKQHNFLLSRKFREALQEALRQLCAPHLYRHSYVGALDYDHVVAEHHARNVTDPASADLRAASNLYTAGL